MGRPLLLLLTAGQTSDYKGARHLIDTLDWIGWDRILFASDYPHWDFDDPLVAIPSFLGADRRRMIYSENARALYDWKLAGDSAVRVPGSQ